MKEKEGRIVAVKFDQSTLAKVEQIAKSEREFEGNRSLFIRRAVYEFLERFESKAQEEAQAA